MSQSDALEKAWAVIVDVFFNTFPVPAPTIPQYSLVDSIADTYFEMRPDILAKTSVSIDDLNQYNGLTVLPKTIGGVFTVLINKKYIKDSVENHRWDWVGTIAHESTHVQDYSGYAKAVNASSYEEIMQISEHGMFNLWTEINARSQGYFFTRKYTVGIENLHNMELIPDIVGRELPGQQEYMYRQYHATADGFQQAYYVAQYIGRLYRLRQLYPEVFDDNWVNRHFGVNGWMADWFFFYTKYPTLADASRHFEEMRAILRQNFRG